MSPYSSLSSGPYWLIGSSILSCLSPITSIGVESTGVRSVYVNSPWAGLSSVPKKLTTLYGGKFLTNNFFLKFSVELNESGLSIKLYLINRL